MAIAPGSAVPVARGRADYGAVQGLGGGAVGLLRGEMARRGVTYAQPVEKLAAIGVDENERNLRNKVSRGKFAAGFMLQCLAALEVPQLRLD